jgi:LuxR family maltose regulon positive regulatory protein
VRVFADVGEPMIELLRQAAARGMASDYAGRLLAAFGAEAQRRTGAREQERTPSPPLIEPLSERELEVLRLLTTRLSSTEMAEELVLSVNTVRSHIKNIYGKLNVHSRADAVQRAEELGLL